MDHAETITLADGARIATWTRPGPAEPPHVVLLHGGPGLWDYLEPLAGLIGDEATTHRYDQRGCGASSPSDEQSVARSVADLDELRAHWGVDRFVPIGHSFGATLALAYAAAYPERVPAVGYVSGVGIGDWRTPFRNERRRRAEPFAARLAELSVPQRTAMARGVTSLAAPDATLLMLAFGPTRLRRLVEGVSQAEIQAAYDGWDLISLDDADTAGLGWPMNTTSPKWYRLGRR